MTTRTAGTHAVADEPVPGPCTLADLRRAAGLTQMQVAKRMGLAGRQRVAHIEARYPAVRYDTLANYMQAIGCRIRFSVGDFHISADRMTADPALVATRTYLTETAGRRGLARLARPGGTASAEELPLQGDAPEPGGDDTGRNEDHPDSAGDQGDSGQGEEP